MLQTHRHIPMPPGAATACLPRDLASAVLVGCVWRSQPRQRHPHRCGGRQVYHISDSALDIDENAILMIAAPARTARRQQQACRPAGA